MGACNRRSARQDLLDAFSVSLHVVAWPLQASAIVKRTELALLSPGRLLGWQSETIELIGNRHRINLLNRREMPRDGHRAPSQVQRKRLVAGQLDEESTRPYQSP